MNLTPEQVEAIDQLDSALCQFLNNAQDEYDPRVWLPTLERDFQDLRRAYNDCHRLKVMDLRAVSLLPTPIHEGREWT